MSIVEQERGYSGDPSKRCEASAVTLSSGAAGGTSSRAQHSTAGPDWGWSLSRPVRKVGHERKRRNGRRGEV